MKLKNQLDKDDNNNIDGDDKHNDKNINYKNIKRVIIP